MIYVLHLNSQADLGKDIEQVSGGVRSHDGRQYVQKQHDGDTAASLPGLYSEKLKSNP